MKNKTIAAILAYFRRRLGYSQVLFGKDIPRSRLPVVLLDLYSGNSGLD